MELSDAFAFAVSQNFSFSYAVGRALCFRLAFAFAFPDACAVFLFKSIAIAQCQSFALLESVESSGNRPKPDGFGLRGFLWRSLPSPVRTLTIRRLTEPY